MGTLERIRQTSPFLLALFALVFIAFFVISDMDPDSISRNSGMVKDVAVINGEPILYKDFENKVRKTEEQQRDQKRNDPTAEDVDVDQLRIQLFNQLVDYTVINQEATKAGANVTDGALLDVMLLNPPQEVKQIFTDSTGKFNEALYQTFVTRPEDAYKGLPAQDKAERIRIFRDYFLTVQENVQQQLLYHNIQQLVTTAGSVISPLYAHELMVSDTAKADVAYMNFDMDLVKPGDVKVSYNEVKKYYEENKQYFTQRDMRRLKVVAFPIVASPNDSANAIKKVKRIYESLNKAKEENNLDSIFAERVRENESEVVDLTPISQINPMMTQIISQLTPGTFTGPVPLPTGFTFVKLNDKKSTTEESVKASHILIKFGDNKAAAKAKIESILARVTPANFADMAKQYSDDGSAQQGGDLGYFKKGQMVKQFEEAAFAAAPNKVVGPVETQYGYHLIMVTDKKSENVEQVAYSAIIIKPMISKMAKKQLVRTANEIVKCINDDGMNMNDAVKKVMQKPVKPIETPYFTSDGHGLGLQSPYCALEAFQEDLNKAYGPWEDKQAGYLIAQVTGIKKAGTPTLSDKYDEIVMLLKKRKQLDIIKAKAQEAYNQIKAKGGDLSKFTADSTSGIKLVTDLKNNGLVSNMGRDFVFTQKAMMLPLNQLSAPIRGDRSYFIMQVLKRSVPSVPKTASRQMMMQFVQQSGSETFNLWYAKVKEDAQIDDKRIDIYGTNL